MTTSLHNVKGNVKTKLRVESRTYRTIIETREKIERAKSQIRVLEKDLKRLEESVA